MQTKRMIWKATALLMAVLPCFILQQAKAASTAPTSVVSDPVATESTNNQTSSSSAIPKENGATAMIADETINEGTEITEIINGVPQTGSSKKKSSITQNSLRDKRSQSNIRTQTRKPAKSY